jgi:hypothetical protein
MTSLSACSDGTPIIDANTYFSRGPAFYPTARDLFRVIVRGYELRKEKHDEYTSTGRDSGVLVIPATRLVATISGVKKAALRLDRSDRLRSVGPPPFTPDQGP